MTDGWLRRWMPHIVAHAGGSTVLELGCGPGEDTRLLCEAGLSVCAIDLSEKALARARERAPGAAFHCQDIRDEFPLRQTGVVVASLSLHYFDWQETLRLVERIRAVLKPGGLLVCRVNSTEDVHFGAVGHDEIEPNFYRVDGQPKRFFDEASLRQVFAGWTVRHLEQCLTFRYVLPKRVWEVVLERDSAERG